jgi:LacI family transcriptional regulator
MLHCANLLSLCAADRYSCFVQTDEPANIGVVLSSEMYCWREVLRGISTFVTGAAQWRLELFSPLEPFVELIRQDSIDGLILGPVNDLDEARAAARAVHGPVVGVVADYQLTRNKVDVLASVGSDDEQVGELAAAHFLSKGYRHFAFLGTAAQWSDERCVGFERRLLRDGRTVAKLDHGGPPGPNARGWGNPHYGADVFAWLLQLPRPLAVLACNDLRARELAELCRVRRVRVPDDVAILGVDNDDLQCVLAFPPISSVAVPWRRIGFEAASVLAAALEGRDPPQRDIRVPPQEVAERQSTDTVAITDPDVSAAIRFIRGNAHRPIGVEDVLAVVPTARRSLEKQFKTVLGRSPLDEIRRAHVERAKRLLAQTELSVSTIADNSGFTSAAWFSKTFLDLVGETPSQYRQRFACR